MPKDTRERLALLASNLRWTWSDEFDSLFGEIDAALWSKVGCNPPAFLAQVGEDALGKRAADPSYRHRLNRACRSLRSYLEDGRPWARRHVTSLRRRPVAYFSAEFGLHDSLPVYSGGLGVLAGDHLKSCSDLGLPIWGVTVLYRQGYFSQAIDGAGWQEEHYADLDFERVPLQPVLDPHGHGLVVQMQSPSGMFPLDLWKLQVGRAGLLLLDGARDPAAAHGDAFRLRLYGGDLSNRLMQEIILGIGGYRALLSIGVRPGVLHLNEGHCAFAALEAIAQMMEEEGLDFAAAVERVRACTVFTTHTPEGAGHDRFPPEMIEEYLGHMRERLRLSPEAFLALGRVNEGDAGEPFCMTVLALKLSGRSNAVSALHGQISRSMWRGLWPAQPVERAAIGHITNGVHVPTWCSRDMAQFFRQKLSSDWMERLRDPRMWEGIEHVDPADFWATKLLMKCSLIDFLQPRIDARHRRVGLPGDPPRLDPDALLIGVARRFAEYKRAWLLFAQPERLERLLAEAGRPVQILVAGKAHPRDGHGKEILRSLHERGGDPRFAGRLVLLENYDLTLARQLIKGCDLWLNLPRRPREACGTSGMKAVFNSTLNMMTLDGWWAEAFDGTNGYAFGEGLTHADAALQDRRDAVDLYDVLEQQVLPDFFERSPQAVPLRWIARIKRALATLAWRYNAERMAIDYATLCYLPAVGAPTSGFPPTG
jgi:starch phosphorylase